MHEKKNAGRKEFLRPSLLSIFLLPVMIGLGSVGICERLSAADSVWVDLGKIDDNQGLARVVVPDGDTTSATIGGRDARKNLSSYDHYFYFDVSDGFAYEGSLPEVHIAADYYDSPGGQLALEYDSPGPDGSDKYKHGDIITFTGTNTWKTAQFHLTDAYLGNRQNGGADFRLRGASGQTFYLDVVIASSNTSGITRTPTDTPTLTPTPTASPTFPPGHDSRIISSNASGDAAVQSDSDIDIISFHSAGSVQKVDETFDNNSQYGKPILISDDGQKWSLESQENMNAALQRTMQRGGHFEHLDLDITIDGENGLPITGIESFAARSIKNLEYLSNYGQSLPYPGILTRSGNKLHWNGEEIQLVGFAYYGAVAGDNCSIAGYLDVLAEYNVNFTRIFALDRWANQACSLTPFPLVSGNRCPGSIFDITEPDPDYFARLRDFVSYAWRKGIIVQYCIFDRCGLQGNKAARWPRNPYNTDNNINSRFTLEGQNYPPSFTNTTGDVANLHTGYFADVVNTIGDCGNVIYEIMNEPMTAFPNVSGFHIWAADRLRDEFGSTHTPTATPTTTPTATPTIRKGDLDDNSEIDIFDLLRLVDILLRRPPEPTFHERHAGDLDNDGDQDLFDVLELVDLVLE